MTRPHPIVVQNRSDATDIRRLITAFAPGTKHHAQSTPTGQSPVIVELLQDIAGDDPRQYDAALMRIDGDAWVDTMQNVRIRNVTRHQLRHGERRIARPVAGLGLCVQGRFGASSTQYSGLQVADCFGCPGILSSADFSWIDVELDALSWGLAEGATSCSETYTIMPGVTSTNEYRTRSLDVARFGGVHSLERRPAGLLTGGIQGAAFACEWRWEILRAVPSVWHNLSGAGTAAALDELTEYDVVNSTNPASQWNKSFAAITDSRCATCIDGSPCGTGPTDRWQCQNNSYKIEINLAVKPGPLTGTEWSVVPSGSGRPWWVGLLHCTLMRSGIQNVVGGAFTNGTVHIANWLGGHDTTDTSTGPTTCPPFRYDFMNPSDDFMRLGGTFAIFAKPVDCASDFFARPLILPLTEGTFAASPGFNSVAGRAAAAGIYVPPQMKVYL